MLLITLCLGRQDNATNQRRLIADVSAPSGHCKPREHFGAERERPANQPRDDFCGARFGEAQGARFGRKTVLSIDVEDWFHAANLAGVVPPAAWDSCELRVEHNTMRMLEILDASNARATFFVLGWVAERSAKLVRTIAEAGHEVACHGYGHQLVYSLQPSEFRADVSRAKHYLEDLLGIPMRGYRAPSFSITDWAIPILQELGFDYDSSVVPTIAHDRYGKLSGVDSGRSVDIAPRGLP